MPSLTGGASGMIDAKLEPALGLQIKIPSPTGQDKKSEPQLSSVQSVTVIGTPVDEMFVTVPATV